MISFKALLRQVLLERMTFKDLLSYSDPERIRRSDDVSARSLQVTSNDEGNEKWRFSYKSNPSTTGNRHQGNITFFKEDVSGKESAAQLDCMVDCSCFSGETLVLMADGVYKPIVDVRVGEYVYTHKGRIKKVVNKLVKKVDINDPTYKIKVCGFPYEMIVTGDHPFYALRGNDSCICGCNTPIWESVYSHKCSSPDLVLSNKFARGHYKKNKDNHRADNCNGIFKWIPVKELRLHEWFLTPWFTVGVGDSDIDFSRLIGYYIAEGCIPSKKGTTVRLTFNLNEWDTIGKDVVSICNKLRYKVSLFKSNHGNWFDVRINDASFKKFCIENIGVGSLKKKMSPTIMEWNNDALKNVFIGSILGDGWIDPKKGMKYLSSNFNLISQISTILNKLNIRHTISIANNPTVEKINTMFQVVIPRGNDAETVREWVTPYLREKDKFISSEKNLKSVHHHRDEGHLKSMKSYEKIQYDGMVYDITVEDDESFIAHGIAVHNCPDYRYRWAYHNALQDAGDVGSKTLNRNNGNPPKYPSNDLGPGLCKHLIALGEYLNTNIEPNAPEPEDVKGKYFKSMPSIKPEKAAQTKYKSPTPSQKQTPQQTINAPAPDDTYNDTRSGLTEGNSKLYDKMQHFITQNPEFTVQYYDED